MSNEKKPKEIHVENLIIHAQNVEVIDERHNREREREAPPVRDPWGFFWGRPAEAPRVAEQENESKAEKEN
ncbi:hypothetical protein KHA93_11965 [Bacillus sp. FJAT-49732]|uniref:Uncharacterized protein n=1 Tax=Lederbergia citrisecunda TaxID=2833583 RepID=A0A942TQQ7_9BACI|nr:hypothetical protein [Lederbergia citrisecunda]MBS4200347.1 hypothetical protein [Lederbergia citrisecunda]